jgi:hypothetical protein
MEIYLLSFVTYKVDGYAFLAVHSDRLTKLVGASNTYWVRGFGYLDTIWGEDGHDREWHLMSGHQPACRGH